MQERLRIIGFVMKRTLHVFFSEMPECLRGIGRVGKYAGWEVYSDRNAGVAIDRDERHLWIPTANMEDKQGVGASCVCDDADSAMELWCVLKTVRNAVNQHLAEMEAADGPEALTAPEWMA